MRRILRMIIFPIAALIAFALGGYSLYESILFSLDGAVVSGQVTNHHEHSGRHGPTYTLDYQYTTEAGVSENGNADVSYETYSSTQNGSSIDIMYVKSQPSISEQVGSHATLWTGLIATAVGLVLATVFAFDVMAVRRGSS